MRSNRTAGALAATCIAALAFAVTYAAASEVVGEPKYRGPTTTLTLRATVAPKLGNPLMRYKLSRVEHGTSVAVRIIRARKATLRLHVGSYRIEGSPVLDLARHCKPVTVRLRPKRTTSVTLKCPLAP